MNILTVMIQFNGTYLYVLKPTTYIYGSLNTRRNNKRYYLYAYYLRPVGFTESKSNLLEGCCGSEV
jgi:hypothetical protein